MGENRRELPALDVFAKSIECLMMKLQEDLQKNVKKCNGVTVRKEEIFYVLTVPAIWNENAKRFMRQAAVQVCSYIRSWVSVSYFVFLGFGFILHVLG